MTHTDAYVSGGYYLSVYDADSVDCTGIRLRTTTLAHDHAQRWFFPDTWAIAWTGDDDDDRREAAARFGLADPEAAIRWVTPRFGTELGAWSTVLSYETAVRAWSEVLGRAPGVQLWGVALHRDDVAAFVAQQTPPPPAPGTSPMGDSGALQAVRRGEPPEAGRRLGYEVLLCEHNTFNSLESLHRVHEAPLIPRNEHGLVTSLADARREAAIASSGGPAWFPWLIIDHRLGAMVG